MRKLLLAFAIFASLSAPAMALSSSPTACITPIHVIKNSNAGTAVNVITTPASGVKITSINASVNDASNTYYMTLLLTDGTTTVRFGQFLLTSGAGYSPGVSLFNYFQKIPGLPHDSDGTPYLIVQPNETLQFAQGSSSSGTSATALQIMVQGCQFQ